jgi:glutamine amidotransferase
MCRLFGFRAVNQSQVHQSLVHAENALLRQSEHHRDGWGVAYYEADTPQIVKSAATACDDEHYRRVSALVSSRTVLAHIRNATAGEAVVHNSHPFQYGRWVFAHNGKIGHFDRIRPRLLAKIAPEFRACIQGETDSECIFFLVLTHLSQRIDLHQESHPLHDIVEGVRSAVRDLCKLTGGMSRGDSSAEASTFLTFILTDGDNMLAHQGGKELYYSTYKNRCAQRHTCPSWSPACENPSVDGQLTHFMLASEALQGENIWQPLGFGEFLGVDARMRVHRFELASQVNMHQHELTPPIISQRSGGEDASQEKRYAEGHIFTAGKRPQIPHGTHQRFV